jgi:hypothetical protein
MFYVKSVFVELVGSFPHLQGEVMTVSRRIHARGKRRPQGATPQTRQGWSVSPKASLAQPSYVRKDPGIRPLKEQVTFGGIQTDK